MTRLCNIYRIMCSVVWSICHIKGSTPEVAEAGEAWPPGIVVLEPGMVVVESGIVVLEPGMVVLEPGMAVLEPGMVVTESV
jgi:hypothetical protein